MRWVCPPLGEWFGAAKTFSEKCVAFQKRAIMHFVNTQNLFLRYPICINSNWAKSLPLVGAADFPHVHLWKPQGAILREWGASCRFDGVREGEVLIVFKHRL